MMIFKQITKEGKIHMVEAEYCFVYNPNSRAINAVSNLIKKQSHIHWWEIEAELAQQGIKPEANGLIILNNMAHGIIKESPLSGVILNMIPQSNVMINQFISNTFLDIASFQNNRLGFDFVELRRTAWNSLEGSYWLDLEFTHSPDVILAKLTALDKRMQVYRF